MRCIPASLRTRTHGQTRRIAARLQRVQDWPSVRGSRLTVCWSS
jgi:hypothetical protein